MIAGDLGAATRGAIAQQTSVWRIREHHLLHSRRRIPPGSELSDATGEKLPEGAALDAFIPREAQFIHHDEVILCSALSL